MFGVILFSHEDITAVLFEAVMEQDAAMGFPVDNIGDGIAARLTVFNKGFPVTMFDVLAAIGVLELTGGLTTATAGCTNDVTTLLDVNDVLFGTVLTIVGLVVSMVLVGVGCTLANVVDALMLTTEVTTLPDAKGVAMGVAVFGTLLIDFELLADVVLKVEGTQTLGGFDVDITNPPPIEFVACIIDGALFEEGAVGPRTTFV